MKKKHTNNNDIDDIDDIDDNDDFDNIDDFEKCLFSIFISCFFRRFEYECTYILYP